MNTLFAITLAQPWPWAVAQLGKRLENRSWTDPRLTPGAWLALHGGKTPKESKNKRFLEMTADVRWLIRNSPGREFTPETIDDFDFRDWTAEEGIFAVCQIEQIYKPFQELEFPDSLASGWRARNQQGEEDQFAWMLENVNVFKSAVKVPGKQGLWPVTGDVLEQVRVEVRILQAEKRAA
jgi:hypothetical protein